MEASNGEPKPGHPSVSIPAQVGSPTNPANLMSPLTARLQQQPHLGQERDKPEPDYALLKDSVIQAIRDLRSDSDMCDVTFLVGIDPRSRLEIRANSTILSLRSPYFKVSLHHHLFHLI